MRIFLISLSSFILVSCGGNSSTADERKPVPPKGSDESSQPWNVPTGPEGAGMLGGLLEGR